MISALERKVHNSFFSMHLLTYSQSYLKSTSHKHLGSQRSIYELPEVHVLLASDPSWKVALWEELKQWDVWTLRLFGIVARIRSLLGRTEQRIQCITY